MKLLSLYKVVQKHRRFRSTFYWSFGVAMGITSLRVEQFCSRRNRGVFWEDLNGISQIIATWHGKHTLSRLRIERGWKSAYSVQFVRVVAVRYVSIYSKRSKCSWNRKATNYDPRCGLLVLASHSSVVFPAVIVITKTYLYNFDPLKPHFYIVKLGFTGVYIIFLISAQNIDCGYSLEPPRRGGSNEYPQSMI